MIYDIILQIDSNIRYVSTDNGIGNEGAKGLGEALILNTTITKLYLAGMKH